jgi:hypothetical protein
MGEFINPFAEGNTGVSLRPSIGRGVMKRGSSTGRGGSLSGIQGRLKKFVTHDVPRNPILLLYFVVGGIIVGYLVYFLVLMVRDLRGGKGQQIASQTKVERVQPATPAPKPAEAKPAPSAVKAAPAEAPHQASPGQTAKVPQKGAQTSAKGGASPTEAAVRAGPPATAPSAAPALPAAPRSPASGPERALDTSNWRQFDFPDSSHLSFPRDWQESEIPAQKNMLYGIRLRVPGADASIECYSTRKQEGGDLARNLRAAMSQQGFAGIAEKKRKIGGLDVVELSGVLADKHMVVAIFDQKPDAFFIASLVATDKDYHRQRPYYDRVLESYASGERGKESVSVQDIEKSIRTGIQQPQSSLIGKMVEITLDDGSTQKGVVIAEDDTSYTLQNYRFGGTYSFTVKKAAIARISR